MTKHRNRYLCKRSHFWRKCDILQDSSGKIALYYCTVDPAVLCYIQYVCVHNTSHSTVVILYVYNRPSPERPSQQRLWLERQMLSEYDLFWKLISSLRLHSLLKFARKQHILDFDPIPCEKLWKFKLHLTLFVLEI
jgi:hypothetical protein